LTNVDNITCLKSSSLPQVFAAKVPIAQVKMNILFLTITDQQNQLLHKYLDLHCNFDFLAWEVGFKAICSKVHFFDYYDSFVSSGPVIMENSIRDLVHRHNVQLIIIPNLYYEISPTFLLELRGNGCRSLIVFFDDSMRFENTNRFYLSSFDYYLTHDPIDGNSLYKPFGIKAEMFPVLPSRSYYDLIIQKIDPKIAKYAQDVVFIGAKIADRSLFVDYLKDNSIDINAFGRGWAAGMLSTEDMISAYNSSKISLSFIKTIDGSGRIQLKARLFEIIMAGGFVLSEFCDELTDYFEIGREIDTFKSPQELLDKVRFYIENSDIREKMATRAKEKVYKNFSFESCWSRYLAEIENGMKKSEYPNHGYVVSEAAIKTFLGWNISIIYGRCMIGQFGLACQQVKFCRRELDGFACNISITTELLKCILRRLLNMVSHNSSFYNQN
jgi:glycosyltransferase involved in cell wall biosynthesis